MGKPDGSGLADLVTAQPSMNFKTPVPAQLIKVAISLLLAGAGIAQARELPDFTELDSHKAPAANASEKFREKIRLFRMQAKIGDPNAQYNLGVMYFKGMGVAQDYETALIWYEKAAFRKFRDAKVQLGWMYANGLGTKQDHQKALQFYREAGEEGSAVAQSALGDIYGTGRGVEVDQYQSVFWYEKAAQQGNVRAQFKLGLAYSTGLGAAMDAQQAGIWFEKSAQQGNADAQYRLAVAYSEGKLFCVTTREPCFGTRKQRTRGIKLHKRVSARWRTTGAVQLRIIRRLFY